MTDEERLLEYTVDRMLKIPGYSPVPGVDEERLEKLLAERRAGGPEGLAGSGPSLVRRVKNFSKAVGKQIRKPKLRSKEESVKILNICRECDFCEVEHMKCLHQDCGCHLNIKATWITQHCPIGKW